MKTAPRLTSAQEPLVGWLRPFAWLDRQFARLETALLCTALLGAATVAAASVLLRLLGLPGSPWLEVLPRYFTLVVAMMGGALATHDGSHISLDLLTRFLPRRVGRVLVIVSDSLAALVCVALAVASARFAGFERDGEATILNWLPTWWPTLLLVWGFGVCAWRFWVRAVRGMPWMALALPVLTFALGWGLLTSPQAVAPLCGLLLVVGLVLGSPLFVVFGGAALVLFLSDGVDAAAVAIEMYRLTEAPTLATLPLFTLLGTILAYSQAPRRLLVLARAWVGWLPGGVLVSSVLVCAFLTTFTGASGVTILALGMLLKELLSEEGYSQKLTLGVITSSGSIGLLFAPALPLILYGVVAKVSIDDMFVGGLIPGWLLMGTVAGYAVWAAHREGALKRTPFHLSEALSALRGAIWEVGLPVLILGMILAGKATVVEAAALGVVYMLGVSFYVHQDVHWFDDLPRLLRSSGVLIGAVLVILSVALAFTGFLVDAQIPQQLVAWASEVLPNKWAFLLAMNLLLLAAGCLLDIFSAIVILAPLLTPVAAVFGVHPVHVGIIFLANLELGYLTPPVGLNLFLASFRFGKPLPAIWRTTLPFLGVLAIALLLITYVPALTLTLLDWYGSG